MRPTGSIVSKQPAAIILREDDPSEGFVSSGASQDAFSDSVLEHQTKKRGPIENFEDFYMQVYEDESMDKKYIQKSGEIFMPQNFEDG